MDLGSAVLSAELALELLDDDARDRVVLCPAPLVEGLVVAAVAAAGGADRDEVAAEAAGALAGQDVGHLARARSRRPRQPTRRRRRPTSSPAPSPSPTRTGCTPGPRRGWCRRCGRSTPASRIRNRTTGSAWVPAGSLSKVATLGVLSGARRRGPGVRATRPARRSTTCSRWPPATSTSRWTARPPPAAGRRRGGRSDHGPIAAVARHGHRPGVVAAARADRPHRDPTRATRPSSGAGSARRSRPSGAACRGCAPAPRARSARPRRRSSTPTCCCSTTPTCSATSAPGSTAVQPAATAWSAAVARSRRESRRHARPLPAGPGRGHRAVRRPVLRALLGVAGTAAPRRAACWWPPT